MSIGDTERATQNRVVSFFKDRDILDYEYLGNLKDAANKNIVKTVFVRTYALADTARS